MGNIVNLLGLGKKVYMRSGLSSWESFIGDQLCVYDLMQGMKLERLDVDIAYQNHKAVTSIYTRDRVLNDWIAILNHTECADAA